MVQAYNTFAIVFAARLHWNENHISSLPLYTACDANHILCCHQYVLNNFRLTALFEGNLTIWFNAL